MKTLCCIICILRSLIELLIVLHLQGQNEQVIDDNVKTLSDTVVSI